MQREDRNDHAKKMVAPIVVTILIVLYYAFYFGFIISFLDGIWKIIVGIIPILLGGGMIYVCIERIREIRSGEEDDLGKY